MLDLFGGSGSTLIAAHKTGRRAYLCEFDPIYCDRIIRRWETYAKDDAEQIACGLQAIARQEGGMSDRRPMQSEAIVAPLPATHELRGRLWQAAGRDPIQAGTVRATRAADQAARGNSSQPRLNEERLKSIILDEAYRTISINDANGPVTIPMAQAVVRSLAVNAAKGNQRAQRLFTQLLSSVERDNKQLHDEWLETAINYKAEWERELDRRNRLGIEAPEPVPHPDHIVIDMNTGSVRITGPMTKEEKVVWDLVQQGAPGLEEEIAKLEKIFADRPAWRLLNDWGYLGRRLRR